jgi:endoglycosylceramidase
MHQDVYNEMFDGEGAPDWAVCTDGVPNTEAPGRWSQNYGTAAAGIAYDHFWTNDVVGNLQGEYDRVWAAVATYFRSNPWVMGCDPFNEPFSTALVRQGDEQFDGQLQCFYTGRSFIGAPAHGAPTISCPPDDPGAGVVPTIESADPTHLVFYEPDIYSARGSTNFVGPMNFPNLVFNVHVYCSQRSPKTGNPTDIASCAAQEQRALTTRAEDRTDLETLAQPNGPAWFVSEFGATSNPTLLDLLTSEGDSSLVGWSYWAWKYYGDPTGSADEALVLPNGHLRGTARVLARAYPEAIAGTPVSMSFDFRSGTFDLAYVPNHAVDAPSVIFVPTGINYPNGYCVRVNGGTVTSRAGTELVRVRNAPSSESVSVSITSRSC